MTFCESTSSIWQLVGIVLFALKIVVPLIIIILGVVDFSKAVVSSKEDDIKFASIMLLKRVITGIIIFLIPTIINLVLTMFNDLNKFTNEASKCRICLLNPLGNNCKTYVKNAKEAREQSHNSFQLQIEQEVEKRITDDLARDEENQKIHQQIEAFIKNKKERDLMKSKGQEEADSADSTDNSNPTGTIETGADISFDKSAIESVSLSSLPCEVYYGSSKLDYLSMNSFIKDKLLNGLKQTCQYLQQNQSIFQNYYIMTGGTYNSGATTYPYPHMYAMGIDLFNEWSYVYNGKTYKPYGSYASSSEYRRFICDVCNGNEACDANLNYQLYVKIFRPLGFCWGGNWGEKNFDPMHYELSKKTNGSCSTSNKIHFTC